MAIDLNGLFLDRFPFSPGGYNDVFRVDPFSGDEFYSVPESGGLLLIAAGLAGLGFSRRKQPG